MSALQQLSNRNFVEKKGVGGEYYTKGIGYYQNRSKEGGESGVQRAFTLPPFR